MIYGSSDDADFAMPQMGIVKAPPSLDAIDDGTIIISDRINDESVHSIFYRLYKAIDKEIEKSRPKAIKVFINSPGGDAFVGLTIAKYMAQSPIPIHTFVVGCAASAAALIFLGGHKRAVLPGSRLMIHDSWTISYSATGEHARRLADLHEGLDKEMVAFVAERTGMKKKHIEEQASKDHWYLDTDEARRLGFDTTVAAPSEGGK